MYRQLFTVSIALSLAACGGGSDPADGGGGMDAGGAMDAGGGGTDAGAVDAGDVDAGDVGDAGDVDAGALDAAIVDAGDVDGGDLDASAGSDAGGMCDAMDVMEGTPCGPTERPAPRYVWNGRSCEFQAWCRCVGPDCGEVYRTEVDCLGAYRACVTSCTSDAECASGSEWCEGGSCVACDNSGLLCDIACSPRGWATYERNGCFPCECGPPSECQGDGDCGRGERCYPGDFCWCPGGGRSPDCCIGNVCDTPGCPEPSPVGCATRGCPSGQSCSTDTGCTSSRCNCDGRSWTCTRDCGGGVCVTP